MNRRRTIRAAALLSGCATVAALWILFAPVALGGGLDYAVVRGSSMVPKLHAGDLAVLRPSDHYRVGEIVAYHNQQLGRVVLHRIVRRAGDHYVFKGDNNGFVDSFRPTEGQLIGRLALRVPLLGSMFGWLHRPTHAALVAGLLAPIVLAGGGLTSGRRRLRRRAEGHRSRAHSRRPERIRRGETARTVFAGTGAVALLFGLLTLVGYAHATKRTIEAPGAFVQQGAWSYAGAAGRGAVYPDGRVTTGQPLFTHLVHRIQIGFHYRFVSALPHEVSGRASLVAALTSSLGWQRTILVQPPTAFRGDHMQLSAPLDLDRLEAQMNAYLQETGLSDDSFNVVVTPRVRVHGRIAATTIDETFDPNPLSFILDRETLRLAQPAPGSPEPGQPPPDPLHPNAVGTLRHDVPQTIAGLQVASLRRFGTFGLLAACLFAILAAGVSIGERRGDELETILRQHRHAIVTVTNGPEPPNGYVDLADFDSLAQLAEGYERPILYEDDRAGSFYVVLDDSVYRYQPGAHADPSFAETPLAGSVVRG